MEDDLEVSVGTEDFDLAGASAELSESLFGSSGDNAADDGPSLEDGESSDGGDTATDIPAAKDDAQAAPVAETTEPAPAEALPAPKTWRPDAAAKWAELPPEVQQEVLKREQDIFKGLETYKADATVGRSVNQIIAPYLPMLEAAGLIELDPNAAFNPTVDDITSYKVNITIEELKANTIPSVLPDVAAAVVNGNYALDFGLKTDEAIYKDSVLDVEEYWNLIAARTADVEDPDTAAINEKVVEAFQSSATEDVFNNTFGGYFIAVGWDQDLINQ